MYKDRQAFLNYVIQPKKKKKSVQSLSLSGEKSLLENRPKNEKKDGCCSEILIHISNESKPVVKEKETIKKIFQGYKCSNNQYK